MSKLFELFPRKFLPERGENYTFYFDGVPFSLKDDGNIRATSSNAYSLDFHYPNSNHSYRIHVKGLVVDVEADIFAPNSTGIFECTGDLAITVYHRGRSKDIRYLYDKDFSEYVFYSTYKRITFDVALLQDIYLEPQESIKIVFRFESLSTSSGQRADGFIDVQLFYRLA